MPPHLIGHLALASPPKDIMSAPDSPNYLPLKNLCLRGAGHPRRRSGGLAWLRPPATLFHPSGMNGLTVASLGFREGVAQTPSQIRVRSRSGRAVGAGTESEEFFWGEQLLARTLRGLTAWHGSGRRLGRWCNTWRACRGPPRRAFGLRRGNGGNAR